MSSDEEITILVCSAISTVGLIFVLFTFYLKQELLNKNYHKLIFYACLSEFFGTLGGLTGLHDEATPACYFQWFMSNYFLLAAILWIFLITMELYFTVILGKSIKNFKLYHIFCWGFPLIATLLPLSTERVGVFVGNEWCYLIPGENSTAWTYGFWIFASFYIWVWLSILVMLIIYARLYIYARSVSAKALHTIISQAVYKLIGYPIISALIWIIPAIRDSYAAVNKTDAGKFLEPPLRELSDGLPFLGGILSAFVFFYTNQSLVKGWKSYFNSGKFVSRDTEQKARTSTSPPGINLVTSDVVASSRETEVTNPMDSIAKEQSSFSSQTGSIRVSSFSLLYNLESNDGKTTELSNK